MSTSTYQIDYTYNNDICLSYFTSTDFTITIDTTCSADYSTFNTVDITTSEWWEDFKAEQEWKDIKQMAKDNKNLQEAIERVKILYYLLKNNDQTQT